MKFDGACNKLPMDRIFPARMRHKKASIVGSSRSSVAGPSRGVSPTPSVSSDKPQQSSDKSRGSVLTNSSRTSSRASIRLTAKKMSQLGLGGTKLGRRVSVAELDS